ncbi:hypothetical protein V8C42DRAFT_359355 [Trichoderma barbatum]
MDSDDEDCPRPVIRYGMIESRKRLERTGFHPEVTLKTPWQIREESIRYLQTKIQRLERAEYILLQKAHLTPRYAAGNGRGHRNRTHGTDVRRLTKGPWFVTAKLGRKAASKKKPKKRPKDSAIESLVDHMYLGPQLLEDVFSDGHRTAMKLSQTSSQMFKLVGNNVSRWDFCSMTYTVQVPSSVMVVVVPKHTIGDILEAQKRYKVKVNSAKWNDTRRKLEFQKDFDNYKLRSIEMEQIYFNWARMWRTECLRAAGPYWSTEDQDIDPQTTDRAKEWWDDDSDGINVMGSLKPLSKMWSANQFEGTGNRLHKMPISLAMESLLKLMCELHRARVHIRVLHLHDVPLLDRRMLAIMLRGLPHVVMVGVYNCPLIHFGDVTAILDLIHEINSGRRENKMPEIKAFDFFPYFNQGMPYAHSNAATYGISWGPIPMDTAQRGFYAIILKAVMKAKAMGINLLFSPDHAFMEYLTKVPNLPLGVYGFLDAVYRYLDVKKEDPNRCNLKLQAIYDMLKPVRLSLETNLADDWPRYYIKEMAKTFLFCCSCGYETFKEFFPAGAKRSLSRRQRVCCACLLQQQLDEESDHWKKQKKQLLDMLCPDWDDSAFNQDAPLFDDGAGLIRLESTATERPPSGQPTFLVEGLMRVTQYCELRVRDRKIVSNSLTKLPSLEDVALDSATGRRWLDAIVLAVREDVHRLGIMELKYRYSQASRRRGIPAFGSTRTDGGAPDHPDENQPPAPAQSHSFFDHRKALAAAIWQKTRGW